MRRKKKQRLIVDVDSTEDPAHGKQENLAFNAHFGKNCFNPPFAFTGDGDCLGVKLRPGNATTVWPPLSLVGNHTEALFKTWEPSGDWSLGARASKWQDRRIISVDIYCSSMFS
jgi:hypothetical protein